MMFSSVFLSIVKEKICNVKSYFLLVSEALLLYIFSMFSSLVLVIFQWEWFLKEGASPVQRLKMDFAVNGKGAPSCTGRFAPSYG